MALNKTLVLAAISVAYHSLVVQGDSKFMGSLEDISSNTFTGVSKGVGSVIGLPLVGGIKVVDGASLVQTVQWDRAADLGTKDVASNTLAVVAKGVRGIVGLPLVGGVEVICIRRVVEAVEWNG